jgi:glycosyltransferase domain-containing protein
MSRDRLTCVVPTHHRAPFLRRLLRFYRECPPGFGFIIVDSSAEAEAAANARVIAEAVAGGLRVEHRRIVLDFVGKLAQALTEVRTPFVMLCADDDVLFPKACHHCADFLAAHPSYVSAQGRSARLNTSRRWFNCYRTKGYCIEDDDPLLRCRRLTNSWFSNFYSVYQTEVLHHLLATVNRHVDCAETYLLAENLLSQLSAIYGRIKILPVMHNLVQAHPDTATHSSRGRKWSDVENRYQRFHSCLHHELCAAGVRSDVAAAHIEGAFRHFRDPASLSQRPKRSLGEWIAHSLKAVEDRINDSAHPANVRHKRSITSRDYAGAETEWATAVALLKRFPRGIPEVPPQLSTHE